MTIKGYTEAEITENLKAAGCTDRIISEFNACGEDKNACMKVLDTYRVGLLAELHEHQQKIDALDYLRHLIRSQ